MTKTLQNSRERTSSVVNIVAFYTRKPMLVRFVLVYLNQRCYKSYDKQLSQTIVCNFISFSACVTYAPQIVYFFKHRAYFDPINIGKSPQDKYFSCSLFVDSNDTTLMFTYFHRQFAEAQFKKKTHKMSQKNYLK